MQPGGIVRREEQEKEEGRLPVDGREVHSGPLSSKRGEQAGKSGELAVRNGHPFADAGGAGLLSLEQRVLQFLGGERRVRSGEACYQLAELAGLVRRREDGVVYSLDHEP